jgi:hypothetical protein
MKRIMRIEIRFDDCREQGHGPSPEAKQGPRSCPPAPHSGAPAPRGRGCSIPPSVAAASASALVQHLHLSV